MLDKNEIPSIKINDEVIYANENMKMRTWRQYLKATTEKDSDSIADLILNAIDIIVIVFNNPKVTKETIDENLSVDEVIPLFKKCNEFMQKLTFSKLSEPKNESKDEAK